MIAAQRAAHLAVREAPILVLLEDALRRQQAQHTVERAGVAAGRSGEIGDRTRFAVDVIRDAGFGRGPEGARRDDREDDVQDADVGRKLRRLSGGLGHSGRA